MKNAAFFLGFAPWIVFAVVAGPSTWIWAAWAALVTAVVVAVPPWVQTRRTNVLDVVGIVFFALLALASFVLDRADLRILEDRAQLLSSVVLVLIVFGGLAVRRPFTEYYAKMSVPREYWDSPSFRHINTVISLVWGLVFVVTALCDAAVMWGASSDLFNWFIPVVAVVAAIKFTLRYPDHAAGSPDHAGRHAGGDRPASAPPQASG
jgi:hypothetical protein